MVGKAVKRLISEKRLHNSAQVQQDVMEDHDMKVGRQYIASVLRNDLGARYKPIKKVPFLGNSSRCLQLRMLYAKFILNQLAAGA